MVDEPHTLLPQDTLFDPTTTIIQTPKLLSTAAGSPLVVSSEPKDCEHVCCTPMSAHCVLSFTHRLTHRRCTQLPTVRAWISRNRPSWKSIHLQPSFPLRTMTIPWFVTPRKCMLAARLTHWKSSRRRSHLTLQQVTHERAEESRSLSPVPHSKYGVAGASHHGTEVRPGGIHLSDSHDVSLTHLRLTGGCFLRSFSREHKLVRTFLTPSRTSFRADNPVEACCNQRSHIPHLELTAVDHHECE